MYEFEILYDTHAIKQFSENLIPFTKVEYFFSQVVKF
jgi:hypothetical protein